jgi:tetratricopeptide (TPR) repeat protein
MMRALRIGMVAALSAGLFLVGGLAFGPDEEETPRLVLPGAVTGLIGPPAGRGLDSTIESLQDRLRVVPDDWAASSALGVAYVQKARVTADPTLYTRADDAFTRALGDGARGFDVNLGLGVLAAARHDFGSALTHGLAASRINPQSADALAVIGDAQIELGRYPDARKTFQRMIDLRPSVASYSRVSYYRELTGDVPGAIDAMATAVDLSGAAADAAWTGYQLGELYFGQGRLTNAADAYRRAHAVDPAAVFPVAGLAKVSAARGDFDEAISVLQELVQRYPSAELVALLGDIASASGRRGLAADQYSVVGAIQQLAAANGVDADLELALFAADHRKSPDATVRQARAAYGRRPSVQAADTLAWALYADHRYGPAERYSNEALRLGTRSALFNFHAGMIALRLGREDAARERLGTALEINPWFSFLHAETARRMFERLERR